MNKGKVIKDQKLRVKHFFELDDVRCQLEGIKDFKSIVNDEGLKIKVQVSTTLKFERPL